MSRRIERREPRRETRFEREEVAPRGSGLKQLIVLLAVAFVVTLGVVVGTRMSSDAIAVLVGVIAGVAASIPCALLLLAVTRRREAERQEPDPDRYGGRYPDRPASPPVIVVTSGGAGPQPLAPWSTTSGLIDGTAFDPAAYGGQPQGRRHFRGMGYEEADEQADWED